MNSPLDGLADLDLDDHDVCRDILSSDKHKLVEGLVYETRFDTWLGALPKTSDGDVCVVDVDAAVVRLPSNSPYAERSEVAAFVWARTRGTGLGRYLSALAGRMPVWLVEYDPDACTFSAAEVVPDGRVHMLKQPLEQVTAYVSSRSCPDTVDISADVRNQKILNQSFWGYLSERYG